MTLTRCDVCCDVLDGILVLTNTAPYAYVVEIKGDNYE